MYSYSSMDFWLKSDLTLGPTDIPTPKNPHPLTQSVLPVTLGHEFSGRVLKAPKSSPLKPGQPVAIDPRLYCKNCPPCRTGETNGCQRWGFLGISGGGGGGFSETVAVEAQLCHPLPADADLQHAALIEPLAVGHRAAKIAEASLSNKCLSTASILILGAGPIGIALITVLRSLNARNIYVSQPSKTRRLHAQSLADIVIDPREENVAQKCRRLTDNKGVDVVFDCAGVQSALNDGMEALTFKGTYVNVALWEIAPVLPPSQFLRKEIRFIGSMAYDDEDFREVVQAFGEGRYKGVERMITGCITLDNIVKEGFDELASHRNQHVKILVTPKQN
ncbi:hypothetical protein VTO42DRAFT_6404 [Malbranchea cinnamomea]